MLEIKPAIKSDADLILHYIKALAIAEKFPFEVTVTLADIENNLLADDANAEALVISYKGKPCGFAVFYFTFSTTTGKRGLHLDDLYLEPKVQGFGIGKKVLVHLSTLAKKYDCARFEWWALKTNDDAIKFYLNLGAKQLDELSIFRLDQTQIDNLSQDCYVAATNGENE